jgi:hypothetical protein
VATVVLLGQPVSVPLDSFSVRSRRRRLLIDQSNAILTIRPVRVFDVSVQIKASVQNWPWKTVGNQLRVEFSLQVLSLAAAAQPAAVTVSNNVAAVAVSADGAVVLGALMPPLALSDNGLVQGTVGAHAFPLTITVPFFLWQTTVQPGFAVSFDTGSAATLATPAYMLAVILSAMVLHALVF